MRRIERNVGAKQLGNQLDVRLLRVKRPLAVIGADEETPATASWIENRAIGVPNAERVYEVDDIVAGEVLAPPMAFLGTDEALKDAANNIG